MKKYTPHNIFAWYRKHQGAIILFFLFLVHSFFSVYGFESRHGFEWDQVDNAWAAKNIIVDRNFPLVGMVAKQNSGFYIGPLYYYYVAIFYFLTNLDPTASFYIATVTSGISFFVLYYFIKKLFDSSVALVSVFIYSISSFIIVADKVQWPINFLAAISIIIFYLLYSILLGREKYIVWLGVVLGLSWQLNFTSIFFFIISFFSIPFFPRTKKTLLYFLFALPLLVLFFIPNIIYDALHKGTSSRHLTTYLNEYYHGFHLTRVVQLAKDAFIEFAAIFDNFYIKQLRYVFLPVFVLVFLRDSFARQRLLFVYLVVLWFVVPWAVFSVYKGEISNYYFTLTRPITVMMLAYITVWIYRQKYFIARLGVVCFWSFFCVVNIFQFLKPMHHSLAYHREQVEEKINRGQVVEFAPGDPEAYIYYAVDYGSK